MIFNKLLIDNCASDHVKKLVINFFNGVDIEKENEIHLSWDEQKILIDLTILHPLVKKYPINRHYCRRFLQKVINTLEKSSECVHDQLYETYCTLMHNDEKLTNIFCFKHYLTKGDLFGCITVKESSNLIVDGTTGLRTWEAAAVLADWALSNKSKFQDKRVLELGSGLGMTGLVISKFCDPALFCFSDCHPRVLSILQENIQINFPKSIKSVLNNHLVQFRDLEHTWEAINVLTLDWTCVREELFDLVPDVVIGADIVYDPSTFQDLCNVFGIIFALNKNVTIFLVSTLRNEKTNQDFINQLCDNNFDIEMIDYKHSSYIHWNERQEYRVMKIRK